MFRKKTKRTPDMKKNEVPDDYRTISVLPREGELRKGFRPFLRPNITDRPYKSLEHYLDVQFRLMREDYISPMRESITEFVENPHKHKYNGGRFYRNVRFKCVHTSRNGIGIAISFNKKLTNIKSLNKRFLFGALLCFSEDNFDSIFFGTVFDRSDELLKNGMIAVTFGDDVFDSRMFQKTYTMFESDVFYLQYGLVLNILKNYTTAIPMQKYIVDLKESQSFPKYIVNNDYSIMIDGVQFNLRENNWPTADQLRLNEFQYNAYKTALTRDFVAIQGPPGTGKTFLGTKIVETLLSDPIMRKYCTPIMIMCHTNHALDKFLEGLLTITKNLVRIGRQSKNELLADHYNLSKMQCEYNVNNIHKEKLFELKEKLNVIQNAYTNALDDDGITDVSLFEKYLPDFHIIKQNLSQFGALNKSRSYLVNWLMMADNRDEIYRFSNGKNINVVTLPNGEPIDVLLDNVNNNQIFNYRKLPSIKKRMLNMEKDRMLCEKKIFKEMTSHYYNNERWAQYKSWNDYLCKILLENMFQLKNELDVTQKLSDKIDSVNKNNVLQTKDVVGLTTTGAAQSNQLINTLKPRIVIIEEAAEVLESHIIVNLTPHCQHLIMIGDHQQLRPSTSSYAIGKKFNLEISLFERLFKNEKNCCKLAVQHRMRPEISRLITPTIYPILVDHPSVELYPDVLGVTKNVYFVDHSIPEQNDSSVFNSKKNEHEAKFVISLAKYFIQQGYKPDEITILTTYSAQFFCIEKHKENVVETNSVRCSVLDGFQGDQNKIIILSLVRSNSENIIGFLEMENRICVALSRAKEGLYIIGNMSILKNKSEIWQQIFNTLIEQGSIGPYLSLKCQNHGVVTNVKCSDDFLQVSEGGCNQLCNVLLECGHYCCSPCHVYLDNHAKYQCIQKCNRICVNDHECQLLCFEKCKCSVMLEKDLPCGHKKMVPCHLDHIKTKCNVKVEVKLGCAHNITVKCFETKLEIKCSERCSHRLPCGHACVKFCHIDDDPTHIKYVCGEKCALYNVGCEKKHSCEKLCHEDCDTICKKMVVKKRSNCTHSDEIECFKNVDDTKCMQKCGRKMVCGHFCEKFCWQECIACKVMVKKTRDCGHTINVYCDMNANSVPCKSKCSFMLDCAHQCLNMCGEPCGLIKCTELVRNPFNSHCGHIFDIPCHLKNTGYSDDYFSSQYCKKPCNAILKPCNHPCMGKCGECMGRIHVPCTSPCGYKLICGHSCENPCHEACDTCPKRCETKCTHSQCLFKCEETCFPCNDPCSKKQCIHKQCEKKCGELCDDMPCDYPCVRKLECGHNCIGLCGEMCPNICRHCNFTEMPKKIFGKRYNKESRYVKLPDCGHLVEVEDMDAWIISESETSAEIAYPKCPYCNTLILNSNRYSNQIRKIKSDIQNIKNKVVGNYTENYALLTNILEDVKSLKNNTKTSILFSKVKLWDECLHKISTDRELRRIEILQPLIPKNNMMSKNKIYSFIVKINILKQIETIVSKSPQVMQHANIVKEIEFILNALNRPGKNFSEQQINDMNHELLRLLRLCDVYDLYQDSTEYKNVLKSICTHIFYSMLSRDEWDKEVKKLFMQLPVKPDVLRELYQTTVKPMGFRQGYWYKCPNGHPYCMADCNNAAMVSKCAECGAKIGRTRTTMAI